MIYKPLLLLLPKLEIVMSITQPNDTRHSPPLLPRLPLYRNLKDNIIHH
jgi:hypothetical protein